jgi:hypothetical protein
VLSVYERFEASVAIVLTAVISSRSPWKIIVTDLFQAPPHSTLGLAILILARGVSYWLMREQRRPDARYGR